MKTLKIILKTIILLALGIFILFAVFYALGLDNKIMELFNNKDSSQISNIPEEKEQEEVENKVINVALTMDDKIKSNTAWCGTFQLIWNDLKNDVIKQDIVFQPQLDVVENLNKGKFDTSKLSESSYYKKQGIPTQELKEEIEKALKEKFNEESDILNNFTFDGDPYKYFLYAMLKKEFEFNKEFEELENGKFGNYDNIEYFGIKPNSENSKELKRQVQVLYYNSKDDFAIKLLTKQNEEIIISKGLEKDTFNDIYSEIQTRSEQYDGNVNFSEEDTLKIPNIKFKIEKDFQELANKTFKDVSGKEHWIEKAVQTIQFELNKKGGKIKSEAGMIINTMSIVNPDEPREFLVDNAFTIFLKEIDKDTPYFAANIEDITLFQ